MRELSQKDLAYEKISGEWDKFISMYDTNRRVEVLVEDFLGNSKIRDKDVLDAGAGLGYFTEAILRHSPAKLTAVDIAPTLVNDIKKKYPRVEAFTADLLNLKASMGERLFDIVLSSEVIEHTPSPYDAITQLVERIKPGGWLAISTPNHYWRWSLSVAQTLRIRKPYKGYENWSDASKLKNAIVNAGMKLERCEGIHIIPWQVVPTPLLRSIDRGIRKHSYGWSVNLAILARKPNGK